MHTKLAFLSSILAFASVGARDEANPAASELDRIDRAINANVCDANSPVNLQPSSVGKEGRKVNIGVKGGVHIFEGTMISQITATGMAVPYSTAASGVCVGVAQFEQDNSAGADGDHEIQVENDREFAFANGAGADAFLVSTPLGSPVYGTDDHTVALTDGGAGARKAVGTFRGLEPDGRVRVYINPDIALLLPV